MKKVLVTGSSGYVATYIMKELAQRYPQVAIVGMSRSAKARDDEIKKFKNITFVKGDCLKPESFAPYLDDVDGIVHTVGTLVEKKGNPNLTYKAMNRDACINMAEGLEKVAEAKGQKKNFVFLSSEKAPPFLDAYLTTKKEAEEFILNECKNLKPTLIRPGFIYDKNYRWWSLPVKAGNDLFYTLNEKVYKHTPFSKQIDFLFPAKSVKLTTVSHFAVEGIMGNIKEDIITNEMMLKFEQNQAK